MNKILFSVFGLLISVSASAQLVNQGGNITIQPGATLRVETNIENQSGTITIDNGGILEVQGNFTNAAGSGTTIAPTGKVRFIGTENSNLALNEDALPNVEMAKTTSNGKVTLLGNTKINGNLEFTGTGNNKIQLDGFDLTLAASSNVTATTNHETNGYVVTNGTGRLVKSVGAAASPVNMEIGDLSKYAPLQVSMTGNAAGNVSARTAISSLNPKYNDADSYINREWIVSTPTVTSTSLVGTYNLNSPTDVVGTQSNIKGCTFAGGGEWNFSGFAGSGNTVTATTTSNTDVVLSGQNFFGKYSSNILLEGPQSGSTMNTLLSLNTTSPYGTGEEVTSIPSNAVDWVLLEVRDPSNHATIISQKSGFILNNGTIVGLDGSSQLRNKVNNTTTGNGFIVVKHRNHLAIMSAVSKNLVSNPSLNFLNGTEATFGSNAMKYSSGVFSMWAGDVTNDNLIDASDRAATWNSRNLTGYLLHDCSMDGVVDATDRAITWNNRNKTTTF